MHAFSLMAMSCMFCLIHIHRYQSCRWMSALQVPSCCLMITPRPSHLCMLQLLTPDITCALLYRCNIMKPATALYRLCLCLRHNFQGAASAMSMLRPRRRYNARRRECWLCSHWARPHEPYTRLWEQRLDHPWGFQWSPPSHSWVHIFQEVVAVPCMHVSSSCWAAHTSIALLQHI